MDENYHYHGYAREAERIRSTKRHHIAWGWRQFFRHVTVPPCSGRILDIGCATGVFLKEAQRRGWTNVTGVEISPSSAAIARELLGCDVLEKPLEHNRFPASHFHAATGYEIIEHLPDPLSFAREVRRILRPGGTFTLTTPNWQSIWERQSREVHRMPPYHLTYFTPDTITKLLQSAGFTSVTTRRKPIAWKGELGPTAPLQLPISVARRALFNQCRNLLFATAVRD